MPSFEGKCSTEIIPLLPCECLDRRYLAYFLRSPNTVSRISAKVAGARMPRADMNFVLGLELSAGRIVYLGELGTFRLTVQSEGAESKDKFTGSNVKKAKLRFTPGLFLKKACKTATFTSLEVKEKAADSGTGGNTGGNTGGDEKPGGL